MQKRAAASRFFSGKKIMGRQVYNIQIWSKRKSTGVPTDSPGRHWNTQVGTFFLLLICSNSIHYSQKPLSIVFVILLPIWKSKQGRGKGKRAEFSPLLFPPYGERKKRLSLLKLKKSDSSLIGRMRPLPHILWMRLMLHEHHVTSKVGRSRVFFCSGS